MLTTTITGHHPSYTIFKCWRPTVRRISTFHAYNSYAKLNQMFHSSNLRLCSTISPTWGAGQRHRLDYCDYTRGKYWIRNQWCNTLCLERYSVLRGPRREQHLWRHQRGRLSMDRWGMSALHLGPILLEERTAAADFLHPRSTLGGCHPHVPLGQSNLK